MAGYRKTPKRYVARRIFLAAIVLVATAGIAYFVAGLFPNAESENSPVNIQPPGQTEDAPQPHPVLTEPSEPDDELEPDEPAPEPHPDDEWRLMLVGPDNPIGQDFSPPQLETVGNFQVDSRIAPALNEMIASAQSEGIALLIVSGYRPAWRQSELHNQQIERFLGQGHSREEAVAVASTIVLPPGTSEHQTGLAVDILTPNHQTFDDAFAYTPAGRWLAENSWRYGFILRYPRDSIEITGVIYEPWHFRYVGIEHAQAIFEGGYIFEEYLAGR